MSTPPVSSVTQLLAAVSQGDSSARKRLWAFIYDELHGLARHQLANEPPGHSRQPTSLVHEAYLRLTAGEDVRWDNRRHFFAAAAKAMRRILVDDARRRGRLKRGGGRRPGELHDEQAAFVEDPAKLLAVDEVLSNLEKMDTRKAEIISLRYFAGMTVGETAKALGVSTRTVDYEWRFARAWLHRELTKGDSTLHPGE